VARVQEEDRRIEFIYDVQVSPEAQRCILSIPRKSRPLLIDAIDSLAFTPRPEDSKLLRDGENLRRLTVGDYRVIYGIEETRREVTIELVRHRSLGYAFLAALAISVRAKRYSR
jgi:mRNA interferase RelE/StbE